MKQLNLFENYVMTVLYLELMWLFLLYMKDWNLAVQEFGDWEKSYYYNCDKIQ